MSCELFDCCSSRRLELFLSEAALCEGILAGAGLNSLREELPPASCCCAAFEAQLHATCSSALPPLTRMLSRGARWS